MVYLLFILVIIQEELHLSQGSCNALTAQLEGLQSALDCESSRLRAMTVKYEQTKQQWETTAGQLQEANETIDGLNE
jgi:chromosome segregation ATPase